MKYLLTSLIFLFLLTTSISGMGQSSQGFKKLITQDSKYFYNPIINDYDSVYLAGVDRLLNLYAHEDKIDETKHNVKIFTEFNDIILDIVISNNELNGSFILYNYGVRNSINAIGNFKNNKLEGECRRYIDNNHMIITEYSKGKKDGFEIWINEIEGCVVDLYFYKRNKLIYKRIKSL